MRRLSENTEALVMKSKQFAVCNQWERDVPVEHLMQVYINGVGEIYCILEGKYLKSKERMEKRLTLLSGVVDEVEVVMVVSQYNYLNDLRA